MLPTVNFFVIFVLTIQITKFDSIELSDQILFVNMLQIWNLKYLRHYRF